MELNRYVGLFVLAVVVMAFSQLLLKASAGRRHANLLREYLNWRVAVAYLMHFSTTLMIIFALRGVELKSGPIIQSLGYIIVLILERVFLGQRLTRKKVVGVALIAAGIIIFGLR